MIKTIFETILDWSEVWPLLIPLIVLLYRHNQPAILKPVIVYLWIAFFINFTGDIIAYYKLTLNFPAWLQSNTPLYNIHSVIRFTCFSYFFISLKQPSFSNIKRIIPVVSLLLITIDLIYFENFFNPSEISNNLLSIEAYLLLVYCMLYYLAQLKEDVAVIASGSDFWIVTGLAIYVVINFFLFLFYNELIGQNDMLADKMWGVHNIAYIILCLFIAKAFYATTTT